MSDWLLDNLGWLIGVIFILIIGFIVSVFVGHANGIQAGYVFDKDYNGPSVVRTSAKTGSVPIYYNEKFTLKIRQRDDGSDEYEWNYFEVPESIWTEAKLGDYFDSRCMCITQGE